MNIAHNKLAAKAKKYAMNIDIENTYLLIITILTGLFSVGIQWPLWISPLLIHLAFILSSAALTAILISAHDDYGRNLNVFAAIDSFPLRFTNGRRNDPKSGSGLFSAILFTMASAFIIAAFLARCLLELSFFLYGLL